MSSEVDLKKFGLNVGLSKKFIKEVLERTKEAVMQFPVLAKSYDLSKKEATRIQNILLSEKEGN